MSERPMIYTPAELKDLPTIFQGQCCDCKIATKDMRVWLCRVAGGVTIERYRNNRWDIVHGNCTDTGVTY